MILQGLDLGRRQPEPAEPVGAGLAQRVVVERIERGADAAPDRRGARGRQLLAADDRGKPGKARLAPPQRRHAREFEDRLQPRVLLDQRVDGVFEIGLGVEVDGHCWMVNFLVVMRGLDPRIHLQSLEDGCGRRQVTSLRRQHMPGNDEIANAATRFPFCAEPERLSPSRPRLFGAAEFRSGARRPAGGSCCGSRISTPTRCRPEFEAAIYRGSRLARHRLGTAGAAAIGAFCRLSRRGRKTVGPGPGLSEFREPRRDRPAGRASARPTAPGRAIPTARRSIRARRSRCRRTSARGLIRIGRALCAAARHGGGLRARRRSRLDRARRRPGRRDAARSPPGRRPGATSSWRARRRRPAIISRW